MPVGVLTLKNLGSLFASHSWQFVKRFSSELQKTQVVSPFGAILLPSVDQVSVLNAKDEKATACQYMMCTLLSKREPKAQ